MYKYKKKIMICLIMLFMALSVNGKSVKKLNNWTSWRGPDQNGIAPEKDWNPKALNKKLKINWKKNLGEGYSSVSIRDEYLYTMGYDKKKDKNVIYCFNVDSGKEIWKYSYKCSKGSYAGPKCSPVIDGPYVYTFSQDGHLLCNNAKTGKLKWEIDIASKYSVSIPRWGLSSSVRIEGKLAMINAGTAGMAFDKKTGKEVWISGTEKCNYSTPIIYTKKKQTLAAIYGQDQLHSVDVKTGDIQWSYPWETRHDVNAADPYIFDKNRKVFISSGYGKGCALLDISKKKPKKLWQNENLSTHFSTVVIIDGYIYGIDGNAGSGDLKCIDVKSGKEKWSYDTGFGSVIAANGYLIVLNESGTLRVVEVNPKKYNEISKSEKILKKLCWTAPVLCRSTIYLRNSKGVLISIDLK